MIISSQQNRQIKSSILEIAKSVEQLVHYNLKPPAHQPESVSGHCKSEVAAISEGRGKEQIVKNFKGSSNQNHLNLNQNSTHQQNSSLSQQSSISSIYEHGGTFQKESACIYPIEDERYKTSATKTNPMIEQELTKHKIIIEGRYGQSLMNHQYSFPRVERLKKKDKIDSQLNTSSFSQNTQQHRQQLYQQQQQHFNINQNALKISGGSNKFQNSNINKVVQDYQFSDMAQVVGSSSNLSKNNNNKNKFRQSKIMVKKESILDLSPNLKNIQQQSTHSKIRRPLVDQSQKQKLINVLRQSKDQNGSNKDQYLQQSNTQILSAQVSPRQNQFITYQTNAQRGLGQQHDSSFQKYQIGQNMNIKQQFNNNSHIGVQLNQNRSVAVSPNMLGNKIMTGYANSPVRINHEKNNMNPGSSSFVKNLKIKQLPSSNQNSNQLKLNFQNQQNFDNHAVNISINKNMGQNQGNLNSGSVDYRLHLPQLSKKESQSQKPSPRNSIFKAEMIINSSVGQGQKLNVNNISNNINNFHQ
eukprot:403332028